MAQVVNESADHVDVTLYGLRFEPGQTLEVPDDQAETLGAPLKVVVTSPGPAVTVPPAATAAPAPAAEPAAAAATTQPASPAAPQEVHAP